MKKLLILIALAAAPAMPAQAAQLSTGNSTSVTVGDSSADTMMRHQDRIHYDRVENRNVEPPLNTEAVPHGRTDARKERAEMRKDQEQPRGNSGKK